MKISFGVGGGDWFGFFLIYNLLLSSPFHKRILSLSKPHPVLFESYPYRVHVTCLSCPYRVLIACTSRAYRVLIASLSHPYRNLIPSLSHPYPDLIPTLSRPYPVLIASLSVKKNDHFLNPVYKLTEIPTLII